MEQSFIPENFDQDKFDRATVENIEHLPSPDKDKVDTLLVWRGIKDATELDYGVDWMLGEDSKELTNEDIAQLEKTVEEANLYMTEPVRQKQEPREITKGKNAPYQIPGFDRIRVFIARDKETAERLMKAHDEDDTKTYGEMSGFPQSAIETYTKATAEEPYEKPLKEKLMLRTELPEDIKNLDFMAFGDFYFSRDNWREEIETPLRWAEEVQEIAPDLYERVVADYRKHFL